MGPGYGPIGSLQLAPGRGVGRVWIERRKWPFSGFTGGRRVLVWNRFFDPVSRE
jgi:hypothetical protein